VETAPVTELKSLKPTAANSPAFQEVLLNTLQHTQETAYQHHPKGSLHMPALGRLKALPRLATSKRTVAALLTPAVGNCSVLVPDCRDALLA